ncbi:MAG: cell division protein FtsZ, partial [Gemmatimonadaceae bacterium]|nr:cell division protein FtsZ [Gemmatimonadaceae bacterium]
QAIEENRDEVLRVLAGADLVFITCGMGGGTGTGAAPVVAEMAREAGALTVGIVTKPFLFEGRKRMRQAEEGIEELRKHVDTMIVVPNERLLAVVGKNIPFQDALKKADEVLLRATEGISGLVTKCGIINVDFADVRTVMKDGGTAIMGTGVATGENRAVEAAQAAISSPLLDNISIAGATGVLINIIGGENEMSLADFQTVGQVIQEAVGDEANIIVGAGVEPAMVGQVRVTVVATGFDKGKAATAATNVTPILTRQPQPAVVPIDTARVARGSAVPRPLPVEGTAPRVSRPVVGLDDMEIPTFIRRQMD